MQTPANIIITNLAISDFIMLAKIPLFIYNSLVQGPALGYRGGLKQFNRQTMNIVKLMFEKSQQNTNFLFFFKLFPLGIVRII